MNQTQFAQHKGWTKGYVSQLKKSGRMVFNLDGSVDIEATEIRIAETADPNRDDVVKRHAETRGAAMVVPSAPAPAKKTKEAGQVTFSDGRAKEQHYKALDAELEYGIKIGKYLSKDEMASAVEDLVTTFKQAMENLPHLVAPVLVGKDLAFVRSTLKQEVHDALLKLHRGFDEKIKQQSPE